MYTAVFEMVTTVMDAPDQIKSFILFDARRREIELKENDRVAVLRIDTSLSYVPIPLGIGLSVKDVENELKDVETVLAPGARRALGELLDNKQQ